MHELEREMLEDLSQKTKKMLIKRLMDAIVARQSARYSTEFLLNERNVIEKNKFFSFILRNEN